MQEPNLNIYGSGESLDSTATNRQN